MYSVFSNAQLAGMVQKQVRNLAEMRDIDQVGQARIEKYAAAFLQVLCKYPVKQAAVHGRYACVVR